MTRQQKTTILAALAVALSVFGGLKAAPPPANLVGEVGEPIVRTGIDIVSTIPTNERQPNPPSYSCSTDDACKPRIAVWREPKVIEFCNGINWVDLPPSVCLDAGS